MNIIHKFNIINNTVDTICISDTVSRILQTIIIYVK